MWKWIIPAGGVLSLVGFAAWSRPGAGQGAEPVAWRADFAAAREEANRAGKPLFVVFRCQR
jgi:hypothetical protein